jgi:hypothetical protein
MSESDVRRTTCFICGCSNLPDKFNADVSIPSFIVDMNARGNVKTVCEKKFKC